MMPLFFGFLFFCWWGIAVVSAVYDASTLDNSALAIVTSMDIWREQQVSLLFFSFTFPAPNLQWFSSVMGLLFWDSNLWGGWGNMVRIPMFMSLTFGVVATFLMSFFGNRLSKG
jgi:hypothetical protein